MQRGEECVFCGKVAKHRTKYDLCSRCWAIPRRRMFVQAVRFALAVIEAPRTVAMIQEMSQAFAHSLNVATGREPVPESFTVSIPLSEHADTSDPPWSLYNDITVV